MVVFEELRWANLTSAEGQVTELARLRNIRMEFHAEALYFLMQAICQN